jgi:hypothetical protein
MESKSFIRETVMKDIGKEMSVTGMGNLLRVPVITTKAIGRFVV